MLHDGILLDALSGSERRRSTRHPADGEMILQWQHEPISTRYPVLDSSENGFRIRTSLPMLEGMIGIVVRLLPEGRTVHRPVMVCWSRYVRATGEYDVGLRAF